MSRLPAYLQPAALYLARRLAACLTVDGPLCHNLRAEARVRIDGRDVAVHDVARQPAQGLLSAYDVDGGGTLDSNELARMGVRAGAILAADTNGDGEIDVAELERYLDEQRAVAMGRTLSKPYSH